MRNRLIGGASRSTMNITTRLNIVKHLNGFTLSMKFRAIGFGRRRIAIKINVVFWLIRMGGRGSGASCCVRSTIDSNDL